MTSPYLEQPIRPMAVALPRLLAQIEGELANEKLDTAERWRLRLRAGLVRSLLAPWVCELASPLLCDKKGAACPVKDVNNSRGV